MLGKLARWLRFLGVDAAYVKGLGDDALLDIARTEGRRLVTRDAALAARAASDPGSLRVTSLDPPEQLREVVRALDIHVDPARTLTRCSVCNARLRDATPEEARHAPPRVRAERDAFWTCPHCGRLYWEGTHTARILRGLEDLRE